MIEVCEWHSRTSSTGNRICRSCYGSLHCMAVALVFSYMMKGGL